MTTTFEYDTEEEIEPKRCDQCYEECEYLGDDRKICCYCMGDSIKNACETCYWSYDNAGYDG